MKETTKKYISLAIDAFGYTNAASYTGILTWLVYKIHTKPDGIVKIVEPKKWLRLLEIGVGISTVVFLIGKLWQSIDKNIPKEKSN